MPQYVWEGIFGILNVLVPGVILALFAAYYQNKRKREIKVEGQLAIDRVDGYEQMLSLYFEAQNLQDATLEEEKRANEILAYFDVDTFHFTYPMALKDESTFEKYYRQLRELHRDYQIYLDDKVSRQLDRSLAVYTLFKNWMDAFCDTEHTVQLGLPKQQAKAHIDWMYKLLGMVMFSHCTRAYVELDNSICRQMKHFSLTYRRHRIRRTIGKVEDKILYFLERWSGRRDVFGKCCHWLLFMSFDKNNKHLINVMKVVPEIMRYVHFSDRFSPQEYFEQKRIPTDEEMELYGRAFMAQMHRS